jgi:hypothetical protein
LWQFQHRLAHFDAQAVIEQLAFGACFVFAALGQLIGTAT